MVSIQKATGGTFFSDAAKTDLIPKLLSGQESHGAPPWYYIVLLLLTFWPGSFFVWPALKNAWQERAAVPVRFCLAWILRAIGSPIVRRVRASDPATGRADRTS